MPQQPIHRACLPRSSVSGAALSLHVIEGQNVSDLRRLSAVTSSCELMKNLLRWQHVAPTCPDTVDGFPFDKR
ncbi:unnamed protein product [Cylicostephanus goldi]|uniref:DNA polymerase alpha/delta/epsilon subunit B domain-containing protein n=1 Tax=Cylicostephanus goldi TaxID=71465 RepID=A0A3P7PXU0_CYLGO|nr:unnamed protein product [Cylicostephanus goldi]